MPRRMVDAFKREIEKGIEPPREDSKAVKQTLAMNPRRQEILQFLCRYPCSRLSRIAKDLGLSVAATKWHLGRLNEHGFVNSKEVLGDLVFFPSSMIEERDVSVTAVLNSERTKVVFREIFLRPGISQKELTEHVQLNQRTVTRHIHKLEQNGLIYSIHDGKFLRYYPTGLYQKLSEDYKKKVPGIRKHLLNLLKKDGVNPKVIRSTDSALHVKITQGETKSVLELSVLPFASVTERIRGL